MGKMLSDQTVSFVFQFLFQVEQLDHEAQVRLDWAALSQLPQAPDQAPVVVDHQGGGEDRGGPREAHQAVHQDKTALTESLGQKRSHCGEIRGNVGAGHVIHVELEYVEAEVGELLHGEPDVPGGGVDDVSHPDVTEVRDILRCLPACQQHSGHDLCKKF